MLCVQCIAHSDGSVHYATKNILLCVCVLPRHAIVCQRENPGASKAAVVCSPRGVDSAGQEVCPSPVRAVVLQGVWGTASTIMKMNLR